MKKVVMILFVIGIAVTLCPMAGLALEHNTGILVGIFEGNDNDADLQGLLEDWLESDLTTMNFSKYEVDEDLIEGAFDIAIEDLTEDGDENQWGSFESELPLIGYTLKAGTYFALYYLSPATTSGYWNMEDLINRGDQTPTLSHFIGGSVESVPEPATMLLLGAGLVGLAGIRRKNRIK